MTLESSKNDPAYEVRIEEVSLLSFYSLTISNTLESDNARCFDTGSLLGEVFFIY